MGMCLVDQGCFDSKLHPDVAYWSVNIVMMKKFVQFVENPKGNMEMKLQITRSHVVAAVGLVTRLALAELAEA
jgi:hypothetical protein